MSASKESERSKPSRPAAITERFIARIIERLENDQVVRRSLPVWGRLHVDRQLPFLYVYRRPRGGDGSRTERLVMGEAAYLLGLGDRSQARGLSALVAGVAEVMTASFGSFLIVEVWPGAADSEADPQRPVFRIHEPRSTEIDSAVEVLHRSLGAVRTKGMRAEVERIPGGRTGPRGLPALVPRDDAARRGWHLLGLEVRPVYWDPVERQEFPLVRRALHKRFTLALRRSVFEFTRRHTTHRPAHHHALGRRSIVKAVWEVDRQLARVSNHFDFLLLVTPTNADAAWGAFQRSRFQKEPSFLYRPLPIDPALAKRELFRVPIERIEDPTLAQLFRDQQSELDRKLSMLGERGDPRFLYGSLQLFGAIEAPLLALALDLLAAIPGRARDESGPAVDAEAFAELAREEIAYYRAVHSGVRSEVHVRADMSGLMVSRGNLLIGRQTRIPASRVKALLNHEVGTHVLTYFNGRAQPFRQLYVGLAGYEELQEGLAVLAEYLVGGLSRPRLRLLAARVVAVQRLVEGATFADVFRELVDAHGFAQRTAFNIAMRTYRCGGFTKDAAYLRGLVQLLAYLKGGGELETLFAGKFSAEHVPIINELQWRGVLEPAPLRPRYLNDPGAEDRLRRVRAGLSVVELVRKRT